MSYADWRKSIESGDQNPPAQTVYKLFTVDVEPLKDRLVRFTITTSDPDRERDIVDAVGVDTTAYQRNPVVLFGHDYRSLPVGRCISLERGSKSIIATTEFATADLNPMAEQVFRMIKAGFLRACSIGFRPLEWVFDEERRGVNFSKVELLEYSIVPVPANAMALIAAGAEGIELSVLKEWAESTLAHIREAEGHTAAAAAVADPDKAAAVAENAAADKTVEEAVAAAVEAVVKQGRVLSRANEDKLRAALAALGQCHEQLKSVLSAVETAPDDSEAAAATIEEKDLDLEIVEIEPTFELSLDPDDDEEEAEPTIELDAASLSEMIRASLGEMVHQETQSAINALRGRID